MVPAELEDPAPLDFAQPKLGLNDIQVGEKNGKLDKNEKSELKAKEKFILSITENGYGKRTDHNDYRVTNRGGKGVKTINITPKTGKLIAIKNVIDEDGLMIINKSGVMIRMNVESMRVMGRATQGVKLINLKENDQISSVAKVEIDEDDESITEESIESALNENSTATIDNSNVKEEGVSNLEDNDSSDL